MEDIISENKTGCIISNELLTDYERLSQSVRRRLLSIGKLDSIVTSSPRSL
jgi:hypothetical protein